jgi:hypothetical protein
VAPNLERVDRVGMHRSRSRWYAAYLAAEMPNRRGVSKLAESFNHACGGEFIGEARRAPAENIGIISMLESPRGNPNRIIKPGVRIGDVRFRCCCRRLSVIE